jgi:glycosyltransferase involved in cell wall biosynthesis
VGHRLSGKGVAVLTPWFPNRPGDQPGAFIADSAVAVTRAGWRVGALVVRPWYPRVARRFAHEMIRGDVRAAAFPLAELQALRVAKLPRAILQGMTDWTSDWIIARALERIARAIAAEVIHAQTEGLAPVAAQVAHKLRLPLVLTLHGINVHPRYLRSRYQLRRLRPALASADRIILVGEPLREFFKSYVGSDRNFAVVPNGIDVPCLEQQRPSPADGPRRLVSVANLHEGKGIDLTLRALARLVGEGIGDWAYRIVGDGRERAPLRELAAELGLAGRVTFVGPVRHAEIFDHLVGNEIFVLPSYREAFGIAYLEAMAAGLLAIGVMDQGPARFIRNGENGLLVPPRDVEALTQVLRDVLTGDRQHWREMADKGRETVRNAYTWDHHAKKLIGLYEQVIFESQSR